jgi:PAS domain S-box-containing protein
MMLTGLDGHFLEVNDAFCQNLGYSRNELLQMRVMDLLPTSQRELFQKKLVMLD